jgi:hypothetical protein
LVDADVVDVTPRLENWEWQNQLTL